MGKKNKGEEAGLSGPNAPNKAAKFEATGDVEVNIDNVAAAVFQLVFEYLVEPLERSFRLTSWPWELHDTRRFRVGGRDYAKTQECWRAYTRLRAVNRQWRTLSEQAVAKSRLNYMANRLDMFQKHGWDCFELIYQPFGYDLPEKMAGMARPWETHPDAQLPPEGLLFFRMHCRNNACAYMYHTFPKIQSCQFRTMDQVRTMVQLSGWSVDIPPTKITDTGVIRVLNRYNDEPPVFVGKPINKSGFCVQQPGEHTWFSVDDGEELTADEVTPAAWPRINRRGQLMLATRQGEDVCAAFLQKLYDQCAKAMHDQETVVNDSST